MNNDKGSCDRLHRILELLRAALASLAPRGQELTILALPVARIQRAVELIEIVLLDLAGSSVASDGKPDKASTR